MANRSFSNGGAIHDCNTTISNSLFSNNYAGLRGGAINAFGFSLSWVDFSENSSRLEGGAINGSGTMDHVSFVANSSLITSGGAVSIYETNGSIDSLITDALFRGNRSGDSSDKGAGLLINSTASVTLNNATFSGNSSSGSGGAIYNTGSGSVSITNSIVWNNRDLNGTGVLSASIVNDGAATITISNSLIQGSGGSTSWNAAAGVNGGSNLDQDPLFILDTDPTTAPTTLGNAHLNVGSPAIEAGDNSVVTSVTDLDGNPRIPDSFVDLGAYAFISYDILVNVTGLGAGTLVLQNNGGDDLTFIGNSSDGFSTSMANTASYLVTVLTQPTSPNQLCEVSNGSGIIDNASVFVSVVCTTIQYNVGVDVSGLANGNSVILDNNGESLTVTADGQFNFATALDDGSAYDVTVTTQPQMPNQICSVVAGSDNMNGSDVLLTVTCTTNQYLVGGMASGLANGNAVLLSLGAEDLSVNSNAAFVFLNPLTDESNYTVSVANHPTQPNQTCALVNPTGIIAGDDISDIEVNCTTNKYLIGGFVTGLHSDNNLVIQNNSGDDLTVTSSGDFDFATAIDDLLGFDVSILNQPTNPIQPCVVSNNTGNVAGSAITTVSIVCEFGDDLIFRNGFE